MTNPANETERALTQDEITASLQALGVIAPEED